MTADLDKIVKGLECCIKFDKTFECGEDCPYKDSCEGEGKCAGLQLHEDCLAVANKLRRVFDVIDLNEASDVVINFIGTDKFIGKQKTEYCEAMEMTESDDLNDALSEE